MLLRHALSLPFLHPMMIPPLFPVLSFPCISLFHSISHFTLPESRFGKKTTTLSLKKEKKPQDKQSCLLSESPWPSSLRLLSFWRWCHQGAPQNASSEGRKKLFPIDHIHRHECVECGAPKPCSWFVVEGKSCKFSIRLETSWWCVWQNDTQMTKLVATRIYWRATKSQMCFLPSSWELNEMMGIP